MSFLMGSLGWWIAGAVAVSIPIIIHLLHRQRTQPVRWGAMMFLKMSVLQQKRRKKVDHWLLMLLRLALMALIVALLARPLMNGDGIAAVAGKPSVDIGIVIDHSLSTRWKSGDKTVYEQAVSTLGELAQKDALKPSDTVSVILAEKTPRKLTQVPVPSDGLGTLVNTLKNQKPGATRASIPEAVQAAREVINRGRNTQKVILVLSDAQRTNWEPQSLDKWNSAVGQHVKGMESRLKVYEVPLTPAGERTNLTVTDVAVNPRVIGQNRTARITATIANTGSTPVSGATASLYVNGQVSGPSHPLPAMDPKKQSQSIAFDHEFTAVNSNSVEVRLDAKDQFDADNTAAASVFVLKSIPVLIVDGQAIGNEIADAATNPAALEHFPSSGYLISAMLADAKDVDSPAFISPTVISFSDSTHLRDLANGKLTRTITMPDKSKRSETIGLEHFAAIILNDIPRLDTAVQNRLLDYARSGHGIWCILGKRTERMFIQDQLTGSNLFRVELKDRQEAAPKPVAIDVKDPQYETLAPFASPEKNVLNGMTTIRWWSLKPLEGDAQVPLATAGGDPLILDHAVGSAGGRVVIWTSPVDGMSGWNNWPSMKAFAPMVNLTAYRLAAGMTKGQDNHVDSGKALVWASPVLQEKEGGGSEMVFPDGTISPAIQWAEVTSPSGQKSRVHPITRDGRQWAFFGDTFEPGRYEVRFNESSLPPVFYGVGIDKAELDETVLTPDDRAWLTSEDHKFIEKSIDVNDLGSMLATGGQKGMELWPMLAGLLLLFLLFETFMTYRMVRRQTAPSVVVGAMPSVPQAA